MGSRVVRRLLARGVEVRCLVRSTSPRNNLAGLDVEIVQGDLSDAATLAPAVRGAASLFHVAADYRLWSPDPTALYRHNVQGTRDLLRSAVDAGVGQIVYCSTVGALGIPADGTPGTETTPVGLDQMVGHYKRSKFLAEQEATALAEAGAPVIIVNPSTPVGPNDIKPTETGRIITRFLQRRMPMYVDTGLNFIDVDDVAEGHLLAAERGTFGRKYILGHENLTLRELLERLAALTGLPAPRAKLPYGVALTVAHVNEFVMGGILRREPGVPVEGVRMARKRMFFDAGRAVRELSLPQSPVDAALTRAIEWFCEHNYAPRPPRFAPGSANGPQLEDHA